MRYGTRTLVGWVVAATVVHVLTFDALGRSDLWWVWLHLYFATVAWPGFLTYHAIKRVPRGAEYRVQWFAWSPVLVGTMAFASVCDLLIRTGQIA